MIKTVIFKTMLVFSGGGIGGLIWGQLLDSGGWSYPKLFSYGGAASVALGILFAINYHTWGKRNEIAIVEKLHPDPSRDANAREEKEVKDNLQVEGTSWI